MKFDFDEYVEHRGYWSVKYDMYGHDKPEDAIPLWIGDMDFRSPPCVRNELAKLAKHGVLGYSYADARYMESLGVWFWDRFRWDIRPEWLVNTTGVVNAIHIAIRSLTEPGDVVMTQEPVYYPFADAVRLTGRKLVSSDLVMNQYGQYDIDFDDFESKASSKKVKLFILCNPHNPVGRVWTADELTKLGEICMRHEIIVVSDEIHQDLIYPGYKHIVFANLSDDFAERTITCTAPSKTFNLAGLNLSNIFIKNQTMRKKFKQEYESTGMPFPGIAGIAGCMAAYDYGAEWLSELLIYLESNMGMVERAAADWPGAVFRRPEATYFAWVDFSGLHLTDEDLNNFMLNRAKVWLGEGYKFGAKGSGFMRINVATARGLLQEALIRITNALN